MPRKKVTKKTASKKAIAKKTKNVNELSQTHGKEEKPVPTSLEQIWGDDGTSKYKTLDADKYRDYLSSLGRSDLQAHAVKIGLVPIDDRTQLTTRLLREFKKHAAKYRPMQDGANSKNSTISEGAILKCPSSLRLAKRPIKRKLD